jgi:hypothetical protein
MAVVRTPEELRAAVDSMFRIRAVESPPDPSGLKKVWHRGARNAELVSEIDLSGHVARHEFSLFDDVLVWERGKGFVTGTAQVEGSTRGAANVAFDLTTDPERMARVTQALEPYKGRDRIIHHLRELVVNLREGKEPVEDLGAVTGSNPSMAAAAPVGGVGLQLGRAAPPRRSLAVVWIGVGLMIVAIALALLALGRS